MISKAYRNWRTRHVQAINFWLHMAGIPACFIVAPVLLAVRQFGWAGAFFVGGYVLQFAGHIIEGNRSGEEMLLRRLTGRKP